MEEERWRNIERVVAEGNGGLEEELRLADLLQRKDWGVSGGVCHGEDVRERLWGEERK